MSPTDGGSSTRSDLRTLVGQPAFFAVMFMAMMLPLSLIISPALPGMATDLGVSDARIGLVVTAITLPPMVLAPVAGVAGDMFGRRAVAIPGLLLYGVAGLAIVGSTSFPVVLGLRGLQGVAMAGIAPLTITLLGDLFDGSIATTAQGMRSSTAGVSLAAGPVVAGLLAGIAWQYPFALYALSLPTMVAVYRWVPETAPERDSGTTVRGTLRQYVRSIAAEISNRSLLVVLAGGFVRFFSLFAFYTFIPIFAVRVLGASSSVAGLLVALSGIRIVLSPTAGWWVSRFSRRWALFGMVVVQIFALALVPFVPNVWWLAGLAVVYGFGDALFDPIVNDGVSSMVEARNRNGVVGGLRVLKEAGKTASPAALGVVLGLGGYISLFYILSGVLAIYGMLVLLYLDRP
jgi:MFS family permease